MCDAAHAMLHTPNQHVSSLQQSKTLHQAAHLIVGAGLIWNAMVQDVGVGCGWVPPTAPITTICLHTVHQHLHGTYECLYGAEV